MANNIRSGITLARKKNKMVLSELANKLKIDVNTLKSWENGAGTVPTDILLEMSKILNVSIEYLIFADDRPPLNISNLNKKQIEIILFMYKTFKYKDWRNID